MLIASLLILNSYLTSAAVAANAGSPRGHCRVSRYHVYMFDETTDDLQADAWEQDSRRRRMKRCHSKCGLVCTV